MNDFDDSSQRPRPGEVIVQRGTSSGEAAELAQLETIAKNLLTAGIVRAKPFTWKDRSIQPSRVDEQWIENNTSRLRQWAEAQGPESAEKRRFDQTHGRLSLFAADIYLVSLRHAVIPMLRADIEVTGKRARKLLDAAVSVDGAPSPREAFDLVMKAKWLASKRSVELDFVTLRKDGCDPTPLEMLTARTRSKANLDALCKTRDPDRLATAEHLRGILEKKSAANGAAKNAVQQWVN